MQPAAGLQQPMQTQAKSAGRPAGAAGHFGPSGDPAYAMYAVKVSSGPASRQLK